MVNLNLSHLGPDILIQLKMGHISDTLSTIDLSLFYFITQHISGKTQTHLDKK